MQLDEAVPKSSFIRISGQVSLQFRLAGLETPIDMMPIISVLWAWWILRPAFFLMLAVGGFLEVVGDEEALARVGKSVIYAFSILS